VLVYRLGRLQTHQDDGHLAEPAKGFALGAERTALRIELLLLFAQDIAHVDGGYPSSLSMSCQFRWPVSAVPHWPFFSVPQGPPTEGIRRASGELAPPSSRRASIGRCHGCRASSVRSRAHCGTCLSPVLYRERHQEGASRRIRHGMGIARAFGPPKPALRQCG
jgi:hypothetical protein